uniref:DUF1282 domain-containing protein n=1 Tax=Archaeoglobus fulgidus TaxID=2234 RepID=A0A7J2TKG3_ARCFL
MDVLLNPDRFFSQRMEMGFRIPLLILLLFAILSSISASISLQFIIEDILGKLGKDAEILAGTILFFTLVGAFLGPFVSWILISAVLYAISKIAGGNGSFSTLARFTAFSFIPPILCIPLTTYLTIETIRSMSFESVISHFVFSSVLTLWQYVYWLFAVKNAMNLSFRRSAIVSAIPLIAYAILSFWSMSVQIGGINTVRTRI